MSAHDDDVVGKAYDARLMRRLLVYLRPYRAWALCALAERNTNADATTQLRISVLFIFLSP